MKKIRQSKFTERSSSAVFLPFFPYFFSHFLSYFSVFLILLIFTGCVRREDDRSGALTLNGNVDDRQMNLAFLISERVAEIYVEEGSRVEKGELLGTLETVRLEKQAAEA